MNRQSTGFTAATQSMLRMAKEWQKQGSLNQAVALYYRLAESHPSTQVGDEATRALIEIADGYEKSGHFRLALSLYENMMSLEGESAESDPS